jgi:hypothetical protein
MRVAMRGQRVNEKICLMVDSEVVGGGWIGRGSAEGGTCARVALQDLICCEEQERDERGNTCLPPLADAKSTECVAAGEDIGVQE